VYLSVFYYKKIKIKILGGCVEHTGMAGRHSPLDILLELSLQHRAWRREAQPQIQ
jgi:hypothetical protein